MNKFGRTKRRAVPVCKGAQYILPSIDLIKKQMNTQNVSSTSSILSTLSISSSFIQMRSNTIIAENVDIESHLVGSDDTDNNLYDPNLTSNNKNPIDDDISENKSTYSYAK
ncbi:7602_t:CDS:2 [Cetraspora pellucida]|uniref:7602_t:CDS:1 n=1 Tax=Cetraspora pellucida TaxID=1433469 RepID=A0A9N9IJY0_9GLOM|nr:7602_t:CDS:2 [Cetraspora pellucida]